MKTLTEIQKDLEKHKPYLFDYYSVKSMAIFGSYSRNENTKNSDLDLLVDFNSKIGIKFIDLADELEELLGVSVDLVSRKGIREPYFKAIEKDLLYV